MLSTVEAGRDIDTYRDEVPLLQSTDCVVEEIVEIVV